MKKTGVILSLTGILGVIGVFVFAKTNISIIIPFLPILVLLKSLFLLGVLMLISTLGNESNLKKLSFLLFTIGSVLAILSVSSIVSTSAFSVEIALIISSYIIMLSQIFENYLKSLILVTLIFPLLSLIGINSGYLSCFGVAYVILIGILSVFKFVKTNKH